MENPIKMDDLGGFPIFFLGNTQMYCRAPQIKEAIANLPTFSTPSADENTYVQT